MALTEAEKKKIPVLFDNGWTNAEIAKKLKVTPQTVSYWEKKLNVSNGDIPTKSQPVARKAKALIPASWTCPHCGGPLLK